MRTATAAAVIVVLAAATFSLSFIPGRSRTLLPIRQGPALVEAKIWGYQLQDLKPSDIAADIDVLVVDHSFDGTGSKALSTTDIEQIKSRRDGRRRIVLAYMSIGEAENYRYYWFKHWNTKWLRPSWLGRENRDWKGDFAVRYWKAAWQRLFFNSAPSLLSDIIERYSPSMQPYADRVLEAGFDGFYLDRVDAYGDWKKERNEEEGQADMVAFVTALSAYVKKRRPGTLIVPQNGEELLANETYLAAIDGVAKEDLVYGIDSDNKKNKDKDIADTIRLLDTAMSTGRPVFTVEYVKSPVKRLLVQKVHEERGYRILFAARDLNKPPELTPPLLVEVPLDAASAPQPAGKDTSPSHAPPAP